MTSSRKMFTTFLTSVIRIIICWMKLAKDYDGGFPSNYVNDVLSSFMLNGLWDDKLNVCWNTITIWHYLERYWVRALSLECQLEFMNVIQWWCNDIFPYMMLYASIFCAICKWFNSSWLKMGLKKFPSL